MSTTPNLSPCPYCKYHPRVRDLSYCTHISCPKCGLLRVEEPTLDRAAKAWETLVATVAQSRDRREL